MAFSDDNNAACGALVSIVPIGVNCVSSKTMEISVYAIAEQQACQNGSDRRHVPFHLDTRICKMTCYVVCKLHESFSSIWLKFKQANGLYRRHGHCYLIISTKGATTHQSITEDFMGKYFL